MASYLQILSLNGATHFQQTINRAAARFTPPKLPPDVSPSEFLLTYLQGHFGQDMGAFYYDKAIEEGLLTMYPEALKFNH